tara:strand:- start:24487 stop:25854 length:1368 start_codon:yes stop_codon:yes gene_type:complete
MKKNVLWWPAMVNPNHKDKYGDFDYFQYSRESLEYWCKKNDVIFVPFTEPVESDLAKFRPQWQKCLFVFEELDRMGIQYDQIWLLDSSAIIRWDCPNVFEIANGKFTASRDLDNMRWVYDSVQGYKEFFNGFELDTTKYINSGNMIFNESHRELFQKLKKMYYENLDEIVDLQDNKVRKGNDQTPFNYLLQMNNIDLKLLPFNYNATHLQRKELFSHNWQLNEDKIPHFIKYCYLWRFNGIPKDQRSNLMKQVWGMIHKNYTLDETQILLNSVNHKDGFRLSTSRKFKEDLLSFFSKNGNSKKSIVEFGSCHGDTTKILCSLFKSVHSVDWQQSNIDLVKQKCKSFDNISYQVANVSEHNWDFPQAEVVFIDASHDYPQVALDIQKALDYFTSSELRIIMDDFGNPNNKSIRKSINEKIAEGLIEVETMIGESPGFKTKSGWEMDDREGVILKRC